MHLKSGQFYWVRHKIEKIWRPAYVLTDPDDNQYLEVLGRGGEPSAIADLDLDRFDWVLMTAPKGPSADHGGGVDKDALYAEAADLGVPKHVVDTFLDKDHDQLIVWASYWANDAQGWKTKFEGEGRKTADVIGGLLDLCRSAGIAIPDDLAAQMAALDVRVRPDDLDDPATATPT